MVVVDSNKLDDISNIASKMGCYYNYRTFYWEGKSLCEISSPYKAFLALIKKKFMENDPICKYFLDI